MADPSITPFLTPKICLAITITKSPLSPNPSTGRQRAYFLNQLFPPPYLTDSQGTHYFFNEVNLEQQYALRTYPGPEGEVWRAMEVWRGSREGEEWVIRVERAWRGFLGTFGERGGLKGFVEVKRDDFRAYGV